MTIAAIEEMETTAVRIPIGEHRWIDADVAVPPDVRGVVVFAHGSGGSRNSPRNRRVAAELNEQKLATVLADLVASEEAIVDESTAALRFDVARLTQRLIDVIDWTQTSGTLATLPLGLFGAGTGAAAALDAAVERPREVRAVVARGGRPDLATSLEDVEAPALFIVGGSDFAVLALNEHAVRRMKGKALLQIVPGATHSFEEPGALDDVAALASNWFVKYLRKP